MPRSTLTTDIIDAIAAIPPGRVATYGGIAALAGNAQAARQVVRVLHTFSSQEDLPWHRVINGKGRIALPRGAASASMGAGFEEQRRRLQAEGVVVDERGRVDLERYLWRPVD